MDIFFVMKQFRVVALSSRNQLLLLDPQQQAFQLPIEGFLITPGATARTLLEDLIGKDIQCTLNKNNTRIRYLNQPFLIQKIQQGAMQTVPKELDESRIYSPEQKARFIQCQATEGAKTEDRTEVVDVSQERKEMLRMFSRGGEVKGNLEWLGEQLMVSIQKDSRIVFLPIRLKAINTLFECLPESNFAHFIQDNLKITVKIERPIYNLIKKRFELVGSLDPHLEVRILSEGWGVVNTATLAIGEGASYSDYLKAEAEAKEGHKGVFSRSCEILAFIYAKNNFIGEVSDVLDGYIFEVTKKAGGRVKLELAMVRCPVGDEVGAFTSREFARKQLIGQEVNVYLHKDSGLNITGSLIRAKDSKDVEAMLVEQGWGFIREEFASSILSLKLTELEKKAKEKGRGLYSKQVGVHRPEDLTAVNIHKEDMYYYRRDETLKRLTENESGVLEGQIDLLTYKVWLQDKNVLLKVKLQGIQGHTIDPLLDEVIQMKAQLKQLYENKLKKRSVQITIVSYQKETNCFLGTIALHNANTLQEILLQESLAYCDREGTVEKLKLAENEARKGKKGLWSAALVAFEPIDPLAAQKQKFRGKFSWVEDGETVFVQPQSNYKTLDMIASQLRTKSVRKVAKQLIVVGSLVAAPYFGDYYRARINSIKNKGVKVIFIDWGNRETIDEGDLRELPEEFKLIERQWLKVKLYLTKPIWNPQYLDRIRNELMEGGDFQFKKEVGDYISTYKNKQNIVLSLIERGIAKGNTAMADENTKATIQHFEAILRREKVGVWEWSDEEEEEPSDQEVND